MSATPDPLRRDPGYLGLTAPVQSLPAAYYFDAAEYLRELGQVWYRNWIYICRSSRARPNIGTSCESRGCTPGQCRHSL